MLQSGVRIQALALLETTWQSAQGPVRLPLRPPARRCSAGRGAPWLRHGFSLPLPRTQPQRTLWQRPGRRKQSLGSHVTCRGAKRGWPHRDAPAQKGGPGGLRSAPSPCSLGPLGAPGLPWPPSSRRRRALLQLHGALERVRGPAPECWQSLNRQRRSVVVLHVAGGSRHTPVLCWPQAQNAQRDHKQTRGCCDLGDKEAQRGGGKGVPERETAAGTPGDTWHSGLGRTGSLLPYHRITA